jgi:hypothetical protein
MQEFYDVDVCLQDCIRAFDVLVFLKKQIAVFDSSIRRCTVAAPSPSARPELIVITAMTTTTPRRPGHLSPSFTPAKAGATSNSHHDPFLSLSLLASCQLSLTADGRLRTTYDVRHSTAPYIYAFLLFPNLELATTVIPPRDVPVLALVRVFAVPCPLPKDIFVMFPASVPIATSEDAHRP